ncbi:MAG TPA: murein L,D-transpeptidase catalytic domain family protein [Pseudobdellovibrionaceae bacterium]|nr:murein L,D-transpeptidase catalytic domain family protein [Pseudobdellovibrionaceae bacterium]
MKGFIMMTAALMLTSANAAMALGSRLPEESKQVTQPQEKQEGLDAVQNIPTGFFLQPSQMSVNLSKYNHLDPKRLVPTKPLEQAVKFYDLNKSKIKNQRYITIVDFTKRASTARMFLIDMSTGAVRTFWVSAGKNSDPDNDGWATSFSNQSGSNKSSLGFYLTGGLYNGGNGRSMYLHGLESSNSNAYKRAIVMHGATYVSAGWAGRSLGCPAIEKQYVNDLLPKLTGGSLLYHYYNQK